MKVTGKAYSDKGCGCPKTGHLDSCCHREPMDRKSAYAGAQLDSRYLGDYYPESRSHDDFFELEKKPLNDRVADLLRNYGPASGAEDLWVAHVAGSFTPETNTDIKSLPGWDNDDLAEWKNNRQCWYLKRLVNDTLIDASGENNLEGMVQLAIRRRFSMGEVVAILRLLNKDTPQFDNRPFSTAVQLINPDRICTPGEFLGKRSQNGSRIIDGFLKNKYGNTLAAYIFDRPVDADPLWPEFTQNKWTRANKYGPRNEDPRLDMRHRQLMIHLKKCRFEEQCRGVSEFAPAVEGMQMHRQLYRELLLRAQFQNQKYGAIYSDYRTEDLTGATGLSIDSGDDKKEYAEFCEGGDLEGFADCSPATKQLMLQMLHHKTHKSKDALKDVNLFHNSPGERVELFNHNNADLAITDFDKGLNRLEASALGLTTNLFTLDFTEGTYSGLRTGQHHVLAMIAADQKLAAKFADFAQCGAAEEAIIDGDELKLPEKIDRQLKDADARKVYFAEHKQTLMDTLWAGPRERLIDFEKDIKAYALAIESGLFTKSQVINRLHGISGEEFNELLTRDGTLFGVASEENNNEE